MAKTALLTGGNSGIGYAAAELLKARGYEVCIAGRNRDRMAQAAESLGVDYAVADMRSLADIKALGARYGESGLDVLVNNAGMAVVQTLDEVDDEAFTSMIETNLRGPLFLTQALLPALEQKAGVIVHVSSVVATKGSPGMCVYQATKGGLSALTKGMAVELAPRGIRVNAVAPGPIDTPMGEKMGSSPAMDLFMEHAMKQLLIPRMGLAAEVAQTILGQIENSYVTGAVWSVDGGYGAS
ncbi:MAG: SDR family oxidoreductase [Gammaproteobacteria bacterium]|nr:SDR family oxidoreductase [Gammaproteobacteria bacterium]